MGMFDRVWVRCPKCGGNIEFQSKAGDCCLDSYTFPEAPATILGDLDGQTARCECGHSVTVRTQCIATLE